MKALVIGWLKVVCKWRERIHVRKKIPGFKKRAVDLDEFSVKRISCYTKS
jgi:hypothetical protein